MVEHASSAISCKPIALDLDIFGNMNPNAIVHFGQDAAIFFMAAFTAETAAQLAVIESIILKSHGAAAIGDNDARTCHFLH